MKIVRVTISVNKENYYFDREYDEKVDAQQNCDNALRFLSDSCNDKQVLAVMAMFKYNMQQRDEFQGAKPAIINLSIVPSIIIENAGIYDLQGNKDE
jgi:hypothetical protein